MGVTGTHSDGVPVVAVCVRRAAGPVLAERVADERFYAASTVKLAVLAAAARALEAGTVKLVTSLISTDTFRSQVPGAPDYRIDPGDVDEVIPAPGTPMPLADVVERMVVVSSNEATNMVTDLVGLDAVNTALADAGATSSTYGCKYSDFAAAANGATRHTTARDLAALMSAVVTGALAGPRWTSLLRHRAHPAHGDRLAGAAEFVEQLEAHAGFALDLNARRGERGRSACRCGSRRRTRPRPPRDACSCRRAATPGWPG